MAEKKEQKKAPFPPPPLAFKSSVVRGGGTDPRLRMDCMDLTADESADATAATKMPESITPKQWLSDNQLENILRIVIDDKYAALVRKFPFVFHASSPLPASNYPIDFLRGRDFRKAQLDSRGFVWMTPVNINSNHWVLMVIDMRRDRQKVIYVLDPMGGDLPASLMHVLRVLFGDSVQIINEYAKVQPDNYQCGVWVIALLIRFILYLAYGDSDTFKLARYTLGHFKIITSETKPEDIALNMFFAKEVRNSFAIHLDEGIARGNKAFI